METEIARAYYAGVKDSLELVLGSGSRSTAIRLLEEKLKLITELAKEKLT